MTKIIAVTPESVSIGLENGTLKEVPTGSLNFVPHVGDEVEVFESADKTVVINKTPSAGRRALKRLAALIMCVIASFVCLVSFDDGEIIWGIVSLAIGLANAKNLIFD